MKVSNSFFKQPTHDIAKQLLGKFLVREISEVGGVRGASSKSRKIYLMITETESYYSEKDLACHARFGKTKRNAVMWEEPGKWYVYMIYGMYFLLNVVTEERGLPAAVLIRAGKFFGENDPRVIVRQKGSREFLNFPEYGPGKLTKVMGIDKYFYGKSARTDRGLHIEDFGVAFKPKKIKRLPRVGVDYAGKWKDKLWRYVHQG